MDGINYVRNAGGGPEDASERDVLELGRKLSGGTLDTPDDRIMEWVKWWWKENGYSNRLPFQDAGLPIAVQVLRSTIEGHRAELRFFSQDDDSILTQVFIVNPIARGDRTALTKQEREGLQAYLDLRLLGVGAEPNIFTFCPLRDWIRSIEESDVRDFPIDSDEYRKSLLFLIPSQVIDALAEKASLSPVEVRRLSLVSLVNAAAESPSNQDEAEMAQPLQLRHCILELLNKRGAVSVMTGDQIRVAIAADGFQFTAGDIEQTVTSLNKEGLIHPIDRDSRGDNPCRYAISDSGRELLSQCPAESETPISDGPWTDALLQWWIDCVSISPHRFASGWYARPEGHPFWTENMLELLANNSLLRTRMLLEFTHEIEPFSLRAVMEGTGPKIVGAQFMAEARRCKIWPTSWKEEDVFTTITWTHCRLDGNNVLHPDLKNLATLKALCVSGKPAGEVFDFRIPLDITAAEVGGEPRFGSIIDALAANVSEKVIVPTWPTKKVTVDCVDDVADELNAVQEQSTGKQVSSQSKNSGTYLRRFIINILKAHHCPEGSVTNTDALGVRKIARELNLLQPKLSAGQAKYQVEKFFNDEFKSLGGKESGWSLYRAAYAVSGSESLLLKWLRSVERKGLAAELAATKIELPPTQHEELPPRLICKCGCPITEDDLSFWGESICRNCRNS